jgi:CBS domain-containing protein
MTEAPVANIIRHPKLILPTDSISRAVEALRVSGLAEIPVISIGRVVGVVTESSILEALLSGNPREVMKQPVSLVMSKDFVCGNVYMSAGQVAELMKDSQRQVLPIVDQYGNYQGIVTRQDVFGALCMTMRPQTVAGLATPLGVYLTTGYLRAGAGNVGLFLTGVVMILTWFASALLVYGFAWLVQLTSPLPLLAILQSPPIGVYNWMDAVRGLLMVAQFLVFLILFRLLPITGYHAAEHQVVHAIESGEPLEIDVVSRMPRVHPRCGTNLVVAVTIFVIMVERIPAQLAALIAVLVVIFAWRSIGGIVQYYITTKPPTRKQLENGIKAGESLLRKYRSNPNYQGTEFDRIWNSGMPMVILGVAVTLPLGFLLDSFLPGLF